MTGNNTAVFGIYRDAEEAERAVNQVAAAGFGHDNISVLVPDDEGAAVTRETNARTVKSGIAGGTKGGVLGGALGLLAGVWAFAIPGFGAFVAAGPVMGVLAGIGAGGTLGGIVGALTSLGVPEDGAKQYEGHIKKGGVFLSVHCASREDAEKAKDLLERTGAKDISSAEETTNAGARRAM